MGYSKSCLTVAAAKPLSSAMDQNTRPRQTTANLPAARNISAHRNHEPALSSFLASALTGKKEDKSASGNNTPRETNKQFLIT
jgi:uncharacterized MAPEG superfamily protein